MAKKKELTVYFCNECGYESAKWIGQCPACRAWNSFVEEKVRPEPAAGKRRSADGAGRSTARVRPRSINEIRPEEHGRIGTGSKELDRVLGGGIVPGSLVLVGGDPGIGKSTLLLQLMRYLSAAGRRVLYVSGEESMHQIRMRADRIGTFADAMQLYCETDLMSVEETITREQPEIVVIDSIQTMMDEEVSSAPGSVSQIRAATGVFMKLAKTLGITIFLIGHVTKEGTVAGPRVLEHMVDTVLYFEGEHQASYRVLRAVKNRFGSTNEIGVFEMREEGLCEVENPSEYMLSGRPIGESGTVTTCIMEGTRPMLLEIQALVCETSFGNPRRTAAGMDYNRMNLLLAVLEKRLGYAMSRYDVYVNIAGGMRISEPALDLSVLLAVASSYRDTVIDDRTICFGEVGLSGEVRGVSMAQQRAAEAARLGFDTCILPQVNCAAVTKLSGMRLIGVHNIKEAIAALIQHS